MSLLTYIFTKLSHNMFLSIRTFWCINMSDVIASNGRPLILLRFFVYFHWRAFMFKVFHFLKTFTDCVSNLCTDFGVSICQMWLHVMKSSLIQLHILGIFVYYNMFQMSLLHKTFTDCVLRQKYRDEKQVYVNFLWLR